MLKLTIDFSSLYACFSNKMSTLIMKYENVNGNSSHKLSSGKFDLSKI